ncbi:MAG: cation-transporting P-type ATPase, partial [Spirochaetia bacterium]
MRNPAAAVTTDQERVLLEACSLTPEECFARMGSREKGLTGEEVEEKRREFGTNEVSTKQAGILLRTYHRFANPLVVQLLIIAGVAFAMGDLRSTIVVAGMVLISVGLSSFQEERSGRSVEKLQAMVRTTVNVIRDGKESEIPLAQIVPGDVVVLDAGTLVPADLRLTLTKDFFVSQSALTGESMPVEKSAGAAPAGAKAALELQNACFQGTNVLSGTARGVVINTGARTYFGAITRKLAGQRSKTS